MGDLGVETFDRLLAERGVGVRIGPFDARIQTRVSGLTAPLFRLYRDYPLRDDAEIFNFHVSLSERRRFGSLRKRLVRFSVDGRVPHEDMPVEHALPVLEWGINLVIALRAHRFIMLHAAVLERGGQAIVMPALPGDGKTTLCAGLAHRGWRLFSDEFGLIEPDSDELVPMPRPMPLKNESIEVIRQFAPEAEMGPVIPGTRKGTIAHVKPPADSVARAGQGARAGWVVFPKWQRDAALTLEEIPQAEGFMFLASNAFNYELRGEAAFIALRNLIDGARCFRLTYSDLDAAVESLRQLCDRSEA